MEVMEVKVGWTVNREVAKVKTLCPLLMRPNWDANQPRVLRLSYLNTGVSWNERVNNPSLMTLKCSTKVQHGNSVCQRTYWGYL